MKVTFKREPREKGLRAVGNTHQSVDIKSNKKKFGAIIAPNWRTKDNKWGVQFCVEKDETITDNNPNCSWMWVSIAKRFDTEDDARAYVNEYIDRFAEKYTFHYFED